MRSLDNEEVFIDFDNLNSLDFTLLHSTIGVSKGGVIIAYEEYLCGHFNFLQGSYDICRLYYVKVFESKSLLSLFFDSNLKYLYAFIKYMVGGIFESDYDLSNYFFLIVDLECYFLCRINFLKYFYFKPICDYNFIIEVLFFDIVLYDYSIDNLNSDFVVREKRIFISISFYWNNYYEESGVYLSVNFFKFNGVKNKFLWRNREGYLNFNGFKILIFDMNSYFIKVRYINSAILLNGFYFISYGNQFNFFNYFGDSLSPLDYFGGYCNQKTLYKLSCFSKNYKNSIRDSSFYKHNLGKKEVKVNFKESIFFQDQDEDISEGFDDDYFDEEDDYLEDV